MRVRDEREYKNLIFMGKYPGRSIKNTVSYTSSPTKYRNLLGGYYDQLIDIADESFGVVRKTQQNVEKTLNSWDNFNAPDYEKYKEEIIRAEEFFERYYSGLFTDCIERDTEQIVEWVNYTKSDGFPSNWWNIQSKAEMVNEKTANEYYGNFNNVKKTIPIWTVTPKVEVLETEVINQDKIRLFQIPPGWFLKLQLKYGKHVSNRLKNYHWSAYGFNPFREGANNLAQNLLKKVLRYIYDISGWDKYIPLMHILYRVLKKIMLKENKMTEQEKEEFDFIIRHTTCPTLKFPDGNCYIKPYGNPSGSGTTTRDNIFCHIFLTYIILQRAHFVKNGEYATDDVMFNQIIKLFGDDVVGSIDEEFAHIETEGFLDDLLKDFSMKKKFFRSTRDDLKDMNFLGFSFHNKNGRFFVPRWNEKRLAYSFTHAGVEKETRENFLQKIFTLTVMSYGCENHELFRNAYNHTLKSLITGKLSSLSSQEEGIARVGYITDELLEGVYMNREV